MYEIRATHYNPRNALFGYVLCIGYIILISCFDSLVMRKEVRKTRMLDIKYTGEGGEGEKDDCEA